MVMPRQRETLTIRNAVLDYKNFKGEKREFNNEGDRNFVVVLDAEQAAAMANDGWNIKPYRQKKWEENGEELYSLKIAVKFGDYPPRCWLVTSGGRTMLGADMIGMFDGLESERVDLVITPYDYDVRGSTGRKAYLRTLFFTMYEDELEQEYAEVPQLASVGGNSTPLELESSARLPYDHEAEVVEESYR